MKKEIIPLLLFLCTINAQIGEVLWEENFNDLDDWIIITRYAGSRVSIDGGELRIINDDEVLAVVDDPRDILPANLI